MNVSRIMMILQPHSAWKWRKGPGTAEGFLLLPEGSMVRYERTKLCSSWGQPNKPCMLVSWRTVTHLKWLHSLHLSERPARRFMILCDTGNQGTWVWGVHSSPTPAGAGLVSNTGEEQIRPSISGGGSLLSKELGSSHPPALSGLWWGAILWHFLKYSL